MVYMDERELEELRRATRAYLATDYIQHVVAEAPPLSDEQRARLRELLTPVRTSLRTLRRTQHGAA